MVRTRVWALVLTSNEFKQSLKAVLQLSICSDSSSRLKYRIQPGSVICLWRVLNTKNKVLKVKKSIIEEGWRLFKTYSSKVFTGCCSSLPTTSFSLAISPRIEIMRSAARIARRRHRMRFSYVYQIRSELWALHRSGLTATCCIVSQICKSILPQASNPGTGENSIILTPAKRAS